MNYLQTLRKQLQEHTDTFSFEYEGTTEICFQTPLGTGRIVSIKTTRTPKAVDWLTIPDRPDFFIDKHGTLYSYASAHAKEKGFIHIAESHQLSLNDICQNKLNIDKIPDITDEFAKEKNISLERLTHIAKTKARRMYLKERPKDSLLYDFQAGNLDTLSLYTYCLYSPEEHVLCILETTTVDKVISSNLSKRKFLPAEKYVFKTAESFLDNPTTMFTQKELDIIEALKPYDSLDGLYVERENQPPTTISKGKLLEHIEKDENYYKDILSLGYKCTYIYSSPTKEDVYDLLESRAIAAGFESYEVFYNKGLRIAGYEDVEPRQNQSISM